MTDRQLLKLEKLINDFIKENDLTLKDVINTLYMWKAYKEKPRTVSNGKKEDLW